MSVISERRKLNSGDGQYLLEHRRVRFISFGIVKYLDDRRCANSRVVVPNRNQRTKRISFDAVFKPDKGLNVLVGRASRPDACTSPEAVLRDGVKVETRHNAKVARAALERLEQVPSLLVVRVHDGSVRKDDLVRSQSLSCSDGRSVPYLEVCNVIAGEALTSREQGVAASSYKSSNTNIFCATTDNGNSKLLEWRIHIAPPAAWLDFGKLATRIVGNSTHLTEVDGDAIVNIVAARRGRVAASTNCELTRSLNKHFDRRRDIFGRRWLEEAVRRQLSLVRPV